MAKYRSLEDRLLSMSVLDPETGCWLWLGHRLKTGYGMIKMNVNGKKAPTTAHRVSYAVFKKPIPEQHDIDHRIGCPRWCIAPDHLTAMPYRAHRAKTAFPKRNPGRALTLPMGAT